MSWHFSMALEVAYSRAAFSAGELSAEWKSTGTEGISSCSDNPKALLITSRSGTTYPPSMAQHGEDVLTWYLAAFPAKPIPARLEAALRRTTYGRKCGASWQRQLPGTYLPRTPQERPSKAPQTTLKRWVTKPTALRLLRLIWERRMKDFGTGYVHTPTTKANYAATSMQKWPVCREFVKRFGRPFPEIHEYLMGWPIGWSDLKQLATGKFPSWLRQHGAL